MSVLAGVSRVAGPSYPAIQQNVVKIRATNPAAVCQTRGYAAPPGAAPGLKLGFRKKETERDAQGNILRKKTPKPLGAFRPLPAAQLTHKLFQSDRSETLSLPTFKNVNKNMIGKATAFAFTENDPALKFGLPKKMLLEYRILSKPCSVIRDVTVAAVEMLEGAKSKSSVENRVVLTGRSGCGKSFLLLQAVEYCIAKGWIVVYIPRAVNLVNSTTPHAYDLRTQTYLQPVFAFQTLQRLLSVNSATLATLQTQRKLMFEKREVPIGTSLTDLIGVGLKDPASAPVVLDALMTELEQQTKIPVLLAVDDFQALYCRTAYRDPHFNTIRPYHLSMPRLLMEYASGRRSFAKGAVLGAITYSDPVYQLPLELREALNLPYDHPPSPYDKRTKGIIEYTKGLRALPVPEQLSLEEASSLFEVWMKDKALVPSVYDELFLSKYSESSGNAREFVWKGLLSSLQT